MNVNTKKVTGDDPKHWDQNELIFLSLKLLNLQHQQK